MLEALAIVAALEGIGLAVLVWYHRSRTRDLETRAEAAEVAVGSLRSVNSELRASLDRVVADTAARNTREAQTDARTAEAARDNPGSAADLLNGLHQDRPGPGLR